MESLSIGQVVLATFPFSDLSSYKLRPCLVIGLADYNDVLLSQITSQRYGSSQAVSLKMNNFSKGSLVANSFVRPDKLATLDRNKVKRVLGTINNNKLNEVKQRLKTILEIN